MVSKTLKNLKVAFVLSKNQNWLGEYNYFKSLLGCIQDIKENTPIQFYIFVGKRNLNFITANKNIKIIETKFFQDKGFFSLLRKVSSYIFKNYDPVLYYLFKKHKINIISHYKPIKGFKTISWLPDFQHIKYPNFFSKKEIKYRNNLYDNYINNSDILIVSSKDSKKDLGKFSKISKKIKVLNFVPEIQFKEIEKKNYLKKDIDIKKKYIFTPNQFWVHKNHICIIEALKILKDKGFVPTCIFTGSSFDHRYPNYFEFLKKKIKSYGLQNQIKYLGILPYKKIVNLMYHSEFIINPSFFEGWSTVVEESKIINKNILLSNIEVHREQNPRFGKYFDPKNPHELAKKIKILINKKKKIIKLKKIRKEYKKNRNLFGKKYIDIILELKNKI